MTGIERLLSIVDAYAAHEQIPLTTVSSRVFNDAKKLTALVSGGADIYSRRLEQAIVWFSKNWPEGAEWPEGVERPDPSLGEED